MTKRARKMIGILFFFVTLLTGKILNVGNSVMAAEGITNGKALNDLALRLGLQSEEEEDFESLKKKLSDFGIDEVKHLKEEGEVLNREKMIALCYGVMATKEEIYRDDYTGGLSKGAFDQLIYYEMNSYNFQGFINYVKRNVEYEYKEEYMGLDKETIKKLERKAKEYHKYEPYKKTVIFLDRIRDLKKFEPEFQDAALRVFLSGIFIGESLGQYQTDRRVFPKRYVKEEEFKETVERLFDKNKRFPMTVDGQLIRKTDLPVNASEYEYILEAFPNEYYDVKFILENYLVRGYDLNIIGNFEKPHKMKRYLRKRGRLNYEDFLKLAKYMKEVQNMKMNVDYRTIDHAWIKKMAEYHLIRRKLLNFGAPDETMIKEYRKKLIKDLKKYLKIIKDNHVIIEAKPMEFDPHSAFIHGERITFRTRMKYRVVSCDNFEENMEYIIFANPIVDDFYGVPERFNNTFKLGKWMEGVYDLRFPDYEEWMKGFQWDHVMISNINNPVRKMRKKKILKQFLVKKKDIKRFRLSEGDEGYIYWK